MSGYSKFSSEDRREVFNKVKEILYNKFGVENTTYSTRLLDTGLDSLDFVELIMECEKVYNIAIPDEVAELCETTGQMVQAILEITAQPKHIPAPAPVSIEIEEDENITAPAVEYDIEVEKIISLYFAVPRAKGTQVAPEDVECTVHVSIEKLCEKYNIQDIVNLPRIDATVVAFSADPIPTMVLIRRVTFGDSGFDLLRFAVRELNIPHSIGTENDSDGASFDTIDIEKDYFRFPKN